MKKCPYCAEEIQGEAIKCKHCGEKLAKPINEAGKPNACPKCCKVYDNTWEVCLNCGIPLIKKSGETLVKDAIHIPPEKNAFKEQKTLTGWKTTIVLFAGVVLIIIIGSIMVLFTSHPEPARPKPAFNIGDRVVVTDKGQQFGGYFEEGTDPLSYAFGGKGKLIETPELEKVANGDKAIVKDVGWENNTPDTHYYTDGTSKTTYIHSGRQKYYIETDSGKRNWILGEGLRKE